MSFQAIGTGSGILGYRQCWCPSPFPLSPSISRFFFLHSSHAIGFHPCFFFKTDVSAPMRSTLHLLMVSFQAWDWLWYPMLWSQMRSMGCARSRNLVSNFCSGQGFNLGPRSLMAASVTTRLRRTPLFSRLLRHAGGYSGTILTPNPQVVCSKCNVVNVTLGFQCYHVV